MVRPATLSRPALKTGSRHAACTCAGLLICAGFSTLCEANAQEPFIYTYKLPEKFIDEGKAAYTGCFVCVARRMCTLMLPLTPPKHCIAAMPLNKTEHPWTQWYDFDERLHGYFKQRSAVKVPPDSDMLFFIPVPTGRKYHSLLLTDGLDHWDAVHQTAQARGISRLPATMCCKTIPRTWTNAVTRSLLLANIFHPPPLLLTLQKTEP